MMPAVSACELCGHSGGFVSLHEGGDFLLGNRDERFRAVQCPHCGHAFLESPPADLARFYPAQYFSSSGESPAGLEWLRKALFQREARLLRRYVRRPRAILEIGPGRGDFLLALGRAYPDARICGFDITAEAGVELSTGTRGALYYATSLDVVAFDARSFDLIVMRHVLEHVPDLSEFLTEIHRIATTDAALYVKVPNRLSLAARFFGSYWYGFDFPRHLRYFSASHLKAALRQAGFPVVRLCHETDAIDWTSSMRFFCADRLGIPARGRRAWSLVFFAIRALLLPLSLLARLCRRSSRIWALARHKGDES